MMTLDRVREIVRATLADFYGEYLEDFAPGVIVQTPQPREDAAGSRWAMARGVRPRRPVGHAPAVRGVPGGRQRRRGECGDPLAHRALTAARDERP
jgi:hypothetical protein